MADGALLLVLGQHEGLGGEVWALRNHKSLLKKVWVHRYVVCRPRQMRIDRQARDARIDELDSKTDSRTQYYLLLLTILCYPHEKTE